MRQKLKEFVFANSEYSFINQLKFYFPLICMAVILSSTGTFVNSALARLSQPLVYISAFSVANSFMTMFQSPLYMISPTIASLADNANKYKQVRKFAVIITLTVTCIMFIFRASGLTRAIFSNIFQLSGKTLNEAVKIFSVFILYPIGLFMKDFSQGVMIKFKKTWLMPVSSIIRVLTLILFVVTVEHLTFIPTALLAGAILICSLYTDAFTSLIGIKATVKNVPKAFEAQSNLANEKPANEVQGDTLTLSNVWRFYWPLIITSFFHTLNSPIINASLGQTVDPDFTISTFSVAWGLCHLISSPLTEFYQVPIGFMKADDSMSEVAVKRFAIFLGIIFTALFLIIGFTGVGMHILTVLIGVEERVAHIANTMIKIATILPVLTVLIQYQTGVMMKNQTTKPLSKGKAINLIALTLILLVSLLLGVENMAIGSIVATVCSYLAELTYLYFSRRYASSN
ncbi:MAG: hypothetical protein GX283_09730 [Clostridiaceae bacterium]|jgi:hypothetical protein|nr:hypothetical protein [Clostridiaceae bacterium]